MDADNSSMVAALLEERRGYVVRGLTNRVAQVDEQLKAYGVAVTDEPLYEDRPKRTRRSDS